VIGEREVKNAVVMNEHANEQNPLVGIIRGNPGVFQAVPTLPLETLTP